MADETGDDRHLPSHVEFHPALTLGAFAASIPFAHHNQVGGGAVPAPPCPPSLSRTVT